MLPVGTAQSFRRVAQINLVEFEADYKMESPQAMFLKKKNEKKKKVIFHQNII